MADQDMLVRKNRVSFRRYKGNIFLDFIHSPSPTSGRSYWPKGFTLADRERESEEFIAREDDIWVSAYQKSGHHWSFQFVNMILSGSAENIPDTKLDVFYDIQPPSAFENHPSPRLFLTHYTLDLIPKDVFKKKCKIILMVRNPKDVVTSLYHHMLNRPTTFRVDADNPPSFADVLELFRNGEVFNGCWCEHTVAWWRHWREHKDTTTMLITYEDMVKNTFENIRRLSKFLDRPLDYATSIAITEAVQFTQVHKFMTNLDAKLGPDLGSVFLRKGKVGDWKNHFTVADSEEFDKLYAAKMADCDLDIEFEPSV